MKKITITLFLITPLFCSTLLHAQNVGIGTINPLAPLHIKRDNEALRIQGITPYISFYDNAGTNKGFLQNYNDNIYLGTPAGNTSGLIQFYVNNNPTMTLEPSGGIGMGTISPAGKLHIRHAGPSAHLILEHPTLDNYSRLLFTNTGATRSWGIAGKIGSAGLPSDILSLYNTENPVEVIAMTGGGNVGIAVSAPVNRLQVGPTIAGFSGYDFFIGYGSGGMGFIQNPAASTWRSSTNISFIANSAAGYVGINTESPTNKLQIGSVGSTGFATNDLAIGNGTAAMAIYQTNTATTIGSTTDIILKPRNNGQGRIGINTNTPGAPLEVDGTVNYYLDYSYHNFNSYYQGINRCNFCTLGVAIQAVGNILATEFDAISDARIKDITGVSNSMKDLQTINSLEVTDYTLKDKVMYGNKPFKKVIAQEVEKVYPQVVSKHVDFIPNVYQLTIKIEKTANGYLLSFAGKHNISKSAKKLRILLAEGQTMEQFEIVSIPNDNQVVINATDLKTDKAFVYGEQVDDFRTVDYEGLTTLNISATQELSKLVKKQQAAIDALTEEIKKMKEKGCGGVQ